MATKVFIGMLYINYKTNKYIVRKTHERTKHKSPFEIPIHFKIAVELNEHPPAEMQCTVTLSQQQIKEMVVNSI